MEFSARYTLTGAFALAVVAAIFAFVLWLSNTTGFGERAEYHIRFSEPVSGIARGSDVLFNGIKVGEVSALQLDPADPSAVLAAISIRADTPVRADTIAGLSHQGLTGAASIMLTGGTSDAGTLPPPSGEAVPVLQADPSASRNWTEAAARVFGRIDDMIGRNSDRFDGILAGLERLAGADGGEADRVVFDLVAPDSFGTAPPPPGRLMVLAEPTIPLALNTDRLVVRTADGALTLMDEARWPDNLPNLLQAKLLQAFENAGHGALVVRPADAFEADYRLVLDVRAFHLADTNPYEAQGDLTAKLMDASGKVVATRQFRMTHPAVSRETGDGVDALRAVFSAIAVDMVEWSLASM